jgi:hypothetical protein
MSSDHFALYVLLRTRNMPQAIYRFSEHKYEAPIILKEPFPRILFHLSDSECMGPPSSFMFLSLAMPRCSNPTIEFFLT